MKSIFLILVAGLMATAGAARAETLALDRAHSKVEVAVRATVDSFVATLADYDAALTTTADGGQIAGAAFHFKFADLKTGKAERDRQMNEWQETTTYPDGEFTLAALEPLGDGRFTARGALRLHGVSKPLAFPVTITSDRTLFAVSGEAPLDTREFGLSPIRKFAVLKVNPVVTVKFHLQAARAAR